jgi:uncharacterized protein GlcG (DUF336 family)
MPTLTLAQANQIVAKALEKARAMKIKPVTVVVLDDAGHLKAMQREDGASMFRFDVATGKAWAAVGMGASSRALAGRAKDNPNFFITLAATAGGKFLPQIGGVLIRDASGAILGAAGASGGTGEEDEAVCAHGIEQADLSLTRLSREPSVRRLGFWVAPHWPAQQGWQQRSRRNQQQAEGDHLDIEPGHHHDDRRRG